MKQFKSPDAETQFLCGLLELQYGEGNIKKMKKLASQIPWARGWPADKEAFWNGEAFLWKHKISKEKRALITKELSFLQDGNNLDLGCGAYSYLPSVGFDCSPEMLKFNEQCQRKVIGDIETSLPFASGEFSSVTAVFVLNYVNNYSLLFSEIFRVLKSGGKFVMILAEKGVHDWQGQKEVNIFSAERWGNILKERGFSVKIKIQEGLVFFLCNKKEKA